MEFGNKRLLWVFFVPIAVFAISFVITLLERVLIYMVGGFLAAWALHFYSRHYFQKGDQNSTTDLS